MTAAEFAQQPICIVSGDATLTKRLQSLLLKALNRKSLKFVMLEDTKEHLVGHFNGQRFYSAIFIDTALGTLGCDAICAAACTQTAGPVIILAPKDHEGQEHLVEVCLSQGAAAVVRKEHLEVNTLGDALRASANLFKVRLRAIYAERRFKDVAESLTDWLWEIDTDLNLVYASRTVTGDTPLFSVGTPFAHNFLPDERGRFEKDMRLLMEERQPFNHREYWGLDAHGERVCWSLSAVPVFDFKMKFVGYRGLSKNITNEKDSRAQLYYLANNDALTGLFNRGRFHDELNQSIRHLKRYGREGTVMMLDLDQFKYVNDTYGHEAGDRILVEVAQLLKSQCRPYDVLARLSADEFGIILPEMGLQDGVNFATDLQHKITDHKVSYKGHEIGTSASMGLAVFPHQAQTPGELMAKVDIAVQRAKQKGRNRLHVFDEQAPDDDAMSRRLKLIDFIIDCLENERVALYFQPIVDLKKPGVNFPISRYEVLMRMIKTDGSIVPPGELISAAEDFGLNTRIDLHIATRAIRMIKDWKHKGRDVALTINLSGLTFDDQEAMDKIGLELEKAKLDPGAVTFEITETAALQDIGRAQQAIRTLKSHGCQFALDDFGVGYSSFTYIKNLDIDYIKIDGSFIKNLNNNEEDHVFVKALTDVARGMNIRTVAEMVENESIVRHLRDIGIDYGQGYFFGKPLPQIIERGYV